MIVLAWVIAPLFSIRRIFFHSNQVSSNEVWPHQRNTLSCVESDKPWHKWVNPTKIKFHKKFQWFFISFRTLLEIKGSRLDNGNKTKYLKTTIWDHFWQIFGKTSVKSVFHHNLRILCTRQNYQIINECQEVRKHQQRYIDSCVYQGIIWKENFLFDDIICFRTFMEWNIDV